MFFILVDLTFATYPSMRRCRMNELSSSFLTRSYAIRTLRQGNLPVTPEPWSVNVSTDIDVFRFCYDLSQLLVENRMMREKLKLKGILWPLKEYLADGGSFGASQKTNIPQINDNFANTSNQDSLIAEILRKQNPLYPITSESIKRLISVYTALPNRTIHGISDTLSGQTNTNRSGVYRDVLGHIVEQGSTIDDYRKLYATVCKSLGGCPIGIIINQRSG